MLTSKRKAHLIVVTAFVLGISVGAAGQFLLSQPPPPVASTPGDVADEMTRAVKLDQSQRSQVMQILGACQKQSQDLREQTRPQYHAIRENARNRIRAILSPEQLVSFNEWIKDLDARREKKQERKQTTK
jgi:Spy/CpxP family protein refolding chaperone